MRSFYLNGDYMEELYYWLAVDSMYIAGPFASHEEASEYLHAETDNGFITVWYGEEKSLMHVDDIAVEYAPFATLQEIVNHQE